MNKMTLEHFYTNSKKSEQKFQNFVLKCLRHQIEELQTSKDRASTCTSVTKKGHGVHNDIKSKLIKQNPTISTHCANLNKRKESCLHNWASS